MIRNISNITIVSLLTLTAFAGTAAAQETNRGWSFVISPYAWGPAMDGSTTIQGRTATLDITRDDFVDAFDGGVMGSVVARKGAWGVFGDVVWTDLGVTSTMPPADVDPTLAITSLQGVRRLTSYADVTAGVRWNHLSTRVEFGAPISLSLDKSRDWVDPIVGVVLRSPHYAGFHASLVADIGGFGVSSDLQWQVFPSVGYDIISWASLETGWRFNDIDYETDEDGGFTYDVLVDGPAAGIAFRF